MSKLHSKFLDFAIKEDWLQFGDFKLKSGRQSPYFMNVGVGFSAERLRALGKFYATAIRGLDFKFDALFGPAYKGIPLATAAAMSLNNKGDPKPSCIFDRKETKDHGEGGRLIGEFKLGARCLIIDDVLTAGTAARNSVKLLKEAGLEPVGLLVLIDREERADPTEPVSAADSLRGEGLRVHSLTSASDILAWLKESESGATGAQIKSMEHYQENWYAASGAKRALA